MAPHFFASYNIRIYAYGCDPMVGCDAELYMKPLKWELRRMPAKLQSWNIKISATNNGNTRVYQSQNRLKRNEHNTTQRNDAVRHCFVYCFYYPPAFGDLRRIWPHFISFYYISIFNYNNNTHARIYAHTNSNANISCYILYSSSAYWSTQHIVCVYV